MCASLVTEHPNYGVIASRLIVSNHQKNTSPSFSETVNTLYQAIDVHGKNTPRITEELWQIVQANKEKLNAVIDYERDYFFDYFGFKTLERSYLTKVDGKVVERPQHMWMRVALGIHGADVKEAIETYHLMSTRYFTHATPTLFNAGTPRPQMSSCFLIGMESDSINGIYNTLNDVAEISKNAGGIGLHIHQIRSTGSHIRGTNGESTGIIPMLRVFNATARYVNQGGKRNGSIAVYLEPSHPDFEKFLDIRKNHGNMEERCLDLFTAAWIPDLFMKRVEANDTWSFFCPDECPGLSDVCGDEYEDLYTKYEREGKARRTIKAQQLFMAIVKSQIETGTPYILFKDAANKKSNQQNVGTIKSSNLCVAPDTMILTDKGYYPISELKDQPVNVWNGKEFSETVVKQTGRNQKLITVSFDNGMKLKCTPYHKFYIETSPRPAQKTRHDVVEAKDLKLGMRIIRYEMPTINSSRSSIKYPYTQGLFAAEGTYNLTDDSLKHRCDFKRWNNTTFCKRHQTFNQSYVDDSERCCAESYTDKPMLWLYGDKKKLIQHVDWRYFNECKSSDRLDVSLPHDIQQKYFVPVNYSMETRIKWLEGYLDGDGCVVHYNGIKNIQVASTNKEFLTRVFYMLQTLGVVASLSVMHKEQSRPLPDGKGGSQNYDCNTTYRMNIDCQSLMHLIDLGFSPKRLDVSDIRPPHHKTNKFVRISGVEDNDEYDDTYCFNEPKEHKGIFNGVITGQCSEILEYSDEKETAVCNLASIALPTFIEKGEDGKHVFNFTKLHEVTGVITKNLCKVIDRNFYPTEKCKRSNFRHRPIGIGVQGLADAYAIMRMPFDSPEAAELNKQIFETIYHGALEASMLIAKKRSELRDELDDPNTTDSRKEDLRKHLQMTPEEEQLTEFRGAYATFNGSPAQKGLLQFDMWNQKPFGRWDWDTLRSDVQKYGIRNSLLLAPMPTASTSQILGFNECFEPFTSNIYQRRTLAGEFTIINKYLIRDLIDLGLWSVDMKNRIIMGNGSIQHITEIPEEIRNLYKTAWELKQRVLIDQAADRGIYICQTQSLNLFVEDPEFNKLSNMHFYSWKKGLKTGIYYLRTRPKAKTIAFSLEATTVATEQQKSPPREEVFVCRRDDPSCTMCSS
jgi:ribonucleoside-diphosphate reductase alpha chain